MCVCDDKQREPIRIQFDSDYHHSHHHYHYHDRVKGHL